jgi:hypothetical protein
MHSTSQYSHFSDGSHSDLPLFFFEIPLRADWLPGFSLLELRQEVLQRADFLDSVVQSRRSLCARRGIRTVHFSDLFLIKRMSQPAELLTGRKAVCTERHTLGQ